MKIATIFNVSDKVFFMWDNMVNEQPVLEIAINVFIDGPRISYKFMDVEGNTIWIPEYKVFESKLELLSSL